mmetsp:Transcript_34555/g.50604  ORF Transcript_34555/g.50604 Transcript_34555/m.50604 type:complete len:266 (+) Transcript_34555:128-925(+)
MPQPWCQGPLAPPSLPFAPPSLPFAPAFRSTFSIGGVFVGVARGVCVFVGRAAANVFPIAGSACWTDSARLVIRSAKEGGGCDCVCPVLGLAERLCLVDASICRREYWVDPTAYRVDVRTAVDVRNGNASWCGSSIWCCAAGRAFLSMSTPASPFAQICSRAATSTHRLLLLILILFSSSSSSSSSCCPGYKTTLEPSPLSFSIKSPMVSVVKSAGEAVMGRQAWIRRESRSCIFFFFFRGPSLDCGQHHFFVVFPGVSCIRRRC